MTPSVSNNSLTTVSSPFVTADGRTVVNITLGDFTKSGVVRNLNNLTGPLSSDQYSVECAVEENYHLQQWLGTVPSAQGGQSDCFTAKGIAYYLGRDTNQTSFQLEIANVNGLVAFLDQLRQAEIDETSKSWEIWRADEGLVEKSAKDAAGYNAAWRYHCTYANDPSLNLIDHHHPAY
jgi:hypothetical protein